MTISTTRTSLVGLGLLLILAAGAAVVLLPPFAVTLALALAVMVFVLVRPRDGVYLVLILLYFPLLPSVPVGPLEFSVTSPLILGLFLGVLGLQRRDNTLRLVRWQAVVLAALVITFLLSTLFSDSLRDSILALPNWLVYCMLLYAFMLLVRSSEDLWKIARLILVLGFTLSIWRVELSPVRLLLGLPVLGINGAVFAFHPAFAVAAVTAIMLRRESTPRFWRGFAWLALFSLVYHGLLYQTRAGWLTWAVMLLLLGMQLRGRARVAFAVGVAAIILMGMFIFAGVIDSNVAQTQTTAQAALGEAPYASANSDDVIRLVARDAGLRMFHTKPLLGWGPNAYYRLKPAFVFYTGKEADLAGAFDAWLIELAEIGIIGTVVISIAFLLPFPLAWQAIKRNQDTTAMLAFGFALGVLGLSVHLLFIDLMYSFAWAHVGLALAASRLALEQRHA